MKCNICESAEMEYSIILSKEGEDTVVVPGSKSNLYTVVAKFVEEVGSSEYRGFHITHAWNCEQCANSQLEWYDSKDSDAYHKAMSGKIRESMEDDGLRKHNEVLELITAIRGSSALELFGLKSFDEQPDLNITEQDSASAIIKEIYTNGNCGQLVKILQLVYPETKPVRLDAWINPEDGSHNRLYHYLADINGRLYDIDGEFHSTLDNYEHEYVSRKEFENENLENYSFKQRGPII